MLSFELEREILGFGEYVKVLAPRLLQSKIKNRVRHTLANYWEESSKKE